MGSKEHDGRMLQNAARINAKAKVLTKVKLFRAEREAEVEKKNASCQIEKLKVELLSRATVDYEIKVRKQIGSYTRSKRRQRRRCRRHAFRKVGGGGDPIAGGGSTRVPTHNSGGARLELHDDEGLPDDRQRHEQGDGKDQHIGASPV
ncbi:hypothetical protein ZIOFF_028448 [Zingiber officinale]|uniref:Uncharacterized protein n=1 Tax=Zingiber officinale TaxID=94328 RepID=A0A8J5GPU9_ZINOF|nr:hypothetical protein ZIOFF_028448 [Zingiber officinale]